MLRFFRNAYYNLSIAHKINVTNILIILIPIVVLAYFSETWSTRSMIEKTINNSVQNLELVTNSLAYMTNNAEQKANIIVANDEVQQIRKKSKSSDNEEIFKYEQIVGSFLDSVFEPRDRLSSSVIYRDDKIAIATSKVDLNLVKLSWPASSSQLPEAEQLNERAILHDANYRWYDLHPIAYLKSDQPVYGVTLKKNIIDALEGSVIGTVVININETNIAGSYSALKYGQSGRFFIVNRYGNIVSSDHKDELFHNIRSEPYFPWAENHVGTGTTFDIHGKRYLITSSRFEPLDWYVLGIIPLSEVTEGTRRVTSSIYLTGFICLLLAIGSSMIISRTISSPLVRLSRSMAKVGLGDFDVNIRPLGKDEVGILSNRFNKMTSQISELLNQISTEQQMKKHYELIALQAQINPHFLYNTLDNLSALIQLNMNEDAFRMVKALSSFYRTVLSGGENAITLKQEMQNAENYLIIQKIRHTDDFDYTITYDERMADLSIPKLSIQPLVENAIYHGIRNKRGKGMITINAYQTPSFAVVSVTDNGAGMTKTRIEEIFRNDGSVRSYGLRSVDERIKLLFGHGYGLKIQCEPEQGTMVAIRLPVWNGVPR